MLETPDTGRTGEPEIAALTDRGLARQQNGTGLVASENAASPDALRAQGSVLTDQHAEGYPGE